MERFLLYLLEMSGVSLLIKAKQSGMVCFAALLLLFLLLLLMGGGDL